MKYFFGIMIVTLHKDVIGIGSKPNNKPKEKPDGIRITADEAIKGIFFADKKELIRFVNDTLSTSHDPETADFLHLPTEFISKKTTKKDDNKVSKGYDKIFADMFFIIDGIMYGLEFQTQRDKTMLCRIVEYQFSALIRSIKETPFPNEYEGEVALPHMALVQLEESDDVPDQYKLWFVNKVTGKKLLQESPIVKLWEHTIEDLAKDGKKLLLPLAPIMFRKKVKNGVLDEKSAREFGQFNVDVFNTMDSLNKQDELSDRALEEMYFALNSLFEYFLKKYIRKDNPARKEVETMFAQLEGPLTVSEIYKAENESLAAENEAMAAENEAMAAENEAMAAEVERLRAELEALKKEKAEL